MPAVFSYGTSLDHWIQPSITRTCNQIRKESIGIFYDETEVIIPIPVKEDGTARNPLADDIFVRSRIDCAVKWLSKLSKRHHNTISSLTILIEVDNDPFSRIPETFQFEQDLKRQAEHWRHLARMLQACGYEKPRLKLMFKFRHPYKDQPHGAQGEQSARVQNGFEDDGGSLRHRRISWDLQRARQFVIVNCLLSKPQNGAIAQRIHLFNLAFSIHSLLCTRAFAPEVVDCVAFPLPCTSMSLCELFLVPPLPRIDEILVSHNNPFADRGPLCRLLQFLLVILLT